ncbi:MAG: MATE family efflux transporter [Anaerolineales bacterium]|nr:MATE family efflux transporter [Anaerolineales bacterium]
MDTSSHPFTEKPHLTLLRLSFPVLMSMTAEPLTALVDTGFISSLGVEPLAALGVGTSALSSIFWIFNFLGVATQTETAQRHGRGEIEKASRTAGLALLMAAGLGLVLTVAVFPYVDELAGLLGAAGQVRALAGEYMRIRLFGAPAVLIMLAAFGTLRGLQDMRTPLWIAVGVNVLNLVMDRILIFGLGPVPVMGVAGSAAASTISQWAGALSVLAVLARKPGLKRPEHVGEMLQLLREGWDLFARTALLNLFLIITTRSANLIGAEAGAAHQVIRQVYVFTSLSLDAFAMTVQTLIGYFFGRGDLVRMKQAARISMFWSLGTGVVLGLLMWLGRNILIALMVPLSSVGVFLSAWAVSSISQPLNAAAFLTDGVHWGTGDYRFLRNAMLTASLVGVAGILMLERSHAATLEAVWIVTAIWVGLRALFGVLRIWPGIGSSVFAQKDTAIRNGSGY